MFCQDIIATGGVDSNAVVFDRPSGQIISTLSGHSKRVGYFIDTYFSYYYLIIHWTCFFSKNLCQYLSLKKIKNKKILSLCMLSL